VEQQLDDLTDLGKARHFNRTALRDYIRLHGEELLQKMLSDNYSNV